MSETREKARALLAAATPGPWHACGADRGGCSCGNVWSVPVDGPVATATGQWEGGENLRATEDAALIASAPTLIAALIAEADANERRAEEAEAGAAAMRACAVRLNELASDGIQSSGPQANLHPAILASMAMKCQRALAADAGRVILDRLERAEAERDARTREVRDEWVRRQTVEQDRDSARAERDALRAELEAERAKVQRMEGRRAMLCAKCDATGLRCLCGAYAPMLTKVANGWRWSCCKRTTNTDTERGCDHCGGSGAVIVYGEPEPT